MTIEENEENLDLSENSKQQGQVPANHSCDQSFLIHQWYLYQLRVERIRRSKYLAFAMSFATLLAGALVWSLVISSLFPALISVAALFVGIIIASLPPLIYNRKLNKAIADEQEAESILLLTIEKGTYTGSIAALDKEQLPELKETSAVDGIYDYNDLVLLQYHAISARNACIILLVPAAVSTIVSAMILGAGLAFVCYLILALLFALTAGVVEYTLRETANDLLKKEVSADGKDYAKSALININSLDVKRHTLKDLRAYVNNPDSYKINNGLADSLGHDPIAHKNTTASLLTFSSDSSLFSDGPDRGDDDATNTAPSHLSLKHVQSCNSLTA